MRWNGELTARSTHLKFLKSVQQSKSYSTKCVYTMSSSLAFFENTKILKAHISVSIKDSPQSYKLQHRCPACLFAVVYLICAPYDSSDAIRSALDELNPMVSLQNHHSGDVRQ